MSKLYTIPISENQRRSKEINDDTAEALAQLGSDISAESAERVNADATLNQAVITLGGTLNNAISETNSNLDNLKTEQNIQLATEKNERREADSILDDKIATESARAKQAETAVDTRLTQQIEAEANARALADNIHAQETKALIEAEQSSRKSEDDSLRTAIAKEVSDRASEINSVKQTIQSNVNNLAPKNNPTFTGTPVVPAVTDAVPDNQIANVKYVKDKVAAVDAKIVVFQKATATTNGKEGLVPAQGKTSKKQVLTSDGWNDLDAAGMTLILPSQNGTLTYNQNSQTPAWNNYDPQKMTLEVTAQTNAGTYKAKFTPKGLYVWADTQLQTAREVEWTINPMLLPKPSANNTTFTFNNQAQSLTIANYNATFENQTGTISATNAGNYTATYSLKNTNNTKWSDGTTANVNIAWVINILYLDKPVSSGTVEFDYDKTVHTLQVLNYNSTYMTQGGTVSTAEAGEYNATYTLKNANNARWKDNSTGVISLPWKIVVRELAKPTLPVDTFTFSYSNNNGAGTMHTINPANYETRFMKMTGTTSASDAGVYEVTFTLLDEKYSWEDKTKTPIKRQWTINRAKVADPVLIANSATYSGANIFIQMKDYGQNWLTGKPAGTSKATWTTSLPTGMSSSGESAYVLNAGSYTFNLTPNKNHCWQDGTFAAKSYTFTVNKQAVTIPSITTGRDYNGQVYTITWTNFNATLMTKSGTESATNAGTYYVTATLKDTNNYMWSDSTTEPKRFSFTINRAKLSQQQSTLEQASAFIYSGNTFTFTPTNYNANYHILGGTLSAKDAGTYTATVKPTANYLWSDGTDTEKSIPWFITKADSVVKPTAANTFFYYTGNKITLQIAGLNTSFVKKIAGTTEETNVGNYSVTYALIDKDNYSWADKTTGDVVITWDIQKETVKLPKWTTSTFTYNGNSQSPVFSADFQTDKINVTGTTSAINAGQYFVTCALKNKNTLLWENGTTDDITMPAWVINRQKLNATQSTLKQSGSLTFNNSEQSVSITNLNSAYHVLSGTTKATAAGSYNAIVALNPNFAWSDGSTSNKTVTWTIQQLKLVRPTVTSATSFYFDNTAKSLTFSTYNTLYINLTGDFSAVRVGGYKCTFKLKYPQSAVWSTGNTTENIVFNWTIAKQTIAKPTASNLSLQYPFTGGNIAPTISGFDANTMTQSGDLNNAGKVGNFAITISLKDPTIYDWDDNTTNDVVVNYSVAPCPVNGSVYVVVTPTYNGNPQSVSLSLGTTSIASIIRPDGSTTRENTLNLLKNFDLSQLTKTDAGTHAVSVTLSDKAVWSDGTVGAKIFYFTIKPKAISQPAVSTEIIHTYNGTTSTNGTAQSVQLVGFDSDTMTLGGITSAINEGVYTAVVTPKKNWAWDTKGSQNPLGLKWAILPKPLSVAQSNLVVSAKKTFTGKPITYTIANSTEQYHTLNPDRPIGLTTSNKLNVTKTFTRSIDVYTCKNFCFNNGATFKTVTVDWNVKTITSRATLKNYSNLPDNGSVQAPTVNIPTAIADFVYIGELSVLSASAAGVYAIEICLKTVYDQGDGTTVDIAEEEILKWRVPDRHYYNTTADVFPTEPRDRHFWLLWAIGSNIITLETQPYCALKDRSYKYTGQPITLPIKNADLNIWSESSDELTQTEIGSYQSRFTTNNKAYKPFYYPLTNQTKYPTNTQLTNRTYSFTWTISNAVVRDIVEPPTFTSATTFEYDGTEKSVTFTAFDGNKLSVGGNLTGTNAGKYSVSFTPINDSYWEDGEQNSVYQKWEITRQYLPREYSFLYQKLALFYTGANQSVTIAGYNATYMSIIYTSQQTAIECGTYYATVRTKSNYRFADGTTEKQVEWSIVRSFTFKPTLTASSYPYNNGNNPAQLVNFDSATMTATYKRGTTVVSSDFILGNYTVTIALKDKTNNAWEDDSTGDVTLSYSIVKRAFTKPKSTMASSGLTYNGKDRNFTSYIANYDANYMNMTGTTSATNAGTYSVTISLKNTSYYSWDDGSTGNITLSFTIKPKKLTAAQSTLSINDFTYDGDIHSLVINGFDSDTMTITAYNTTGTTGFNANSQKLFAAGNYSVSVKPTANYQWSDGTTNAKTVSCTVAKRIFPLPAFTVSPTFTYDGKEKDVSTLPTNLSTSSEYSGYTLEAFRDTGKKTAPGTYQWYIMFNNIHTERKSVEWEDGTTNNKALTWYIVIDDFPKPTVNADLTYNAAAQSPVLNNFVSDFMETSSQTSATNAGTYTIVVKLKDKTNTKWQDGTTADVSLKWTIKRKSTGIAQSAALAYPAMTYNGKEQTLSPTSHRVDYFTIAGTTKATNAGTYSVTITPKANYCWSDGTFTTKSFTWTINKADPQFSVSPSTWTLNDNTADWSNFDKKEGYVGMYKSPFKFSFQGTGSISLKKYNDGNAITGGNQYILGSIRNNDSFWFTIQQNCQNIEINFRLSGNDNYNEAYCKATLNINLTLEGMSWAAIKERCQGAWALVPSFAKIGDTKTISGNVKATLIGFNHNSEIEGSYRAHFAVFNAGVSMAHHTTDTNAGGWKDSDIRKYLNDTYLKSLPSDLQSVIIAIDKYTDNVGGSTKNAANVTKTTDKVWLLGAYEIDRNRLGRLYTLNTAEGDFQSQYEFFANGNSGADDKQNRWGRSPNIGENANSFIGFDETGLVPYVSTQSHLLTPCFAISAIV